jgi:hypothetical protein
MLTTGYEDTAGYDSFWGFALENLTFLGLLVEELCSLGNKLKRHISASCLMSPFSQPYLRNVGCFTKGANLSYTLVSAKVHVVRLGIRQSSYHMRLGETCSPCHDYSCSVLAIVHGTVHHHRHN